MFEPAHEIMVLITLATSKGSGEPAHHQEMARLVFNVGLYLPSRTEKAIRVLLQPDTELF